MLFWALGNLVVRDSTLTGPQLAFWRYLMAAGIYTGVHLVALGPLRWREFVRAAPTGLAIVLEIAAFFMAINRTTVANVTVIAALLPLLLFAVAGLRFGEKVPVRVVIATVLGLVGVAAVVFGSTGEATWSLSGDLLAVVALALFALYLTFAKIARETLSVVALQTHSLIIGVPVLAVITVIQSGELGVPSGGEWWHPVALVALPSTGHLLVNWAHSHVTLTFTSLATLIVPVISVIGAWILFDETLRGVQFAGIAVALVVLAFAITETARMTPPAESEHGEPLPEDPQLERS